MHGLEYYHRSHVQTCLPDIVLLCSRQTVGHELESHIEDFKCPRVDTNFICSCSTRYLTRSRECRRFPNIFQRVPKIFENSPKTIRSSYEHFWSLYFPKMSEDYRKLPNISEQSLKMFQSYRNKFRFVQQLSLVNLIARMMSLIFPMWRYQIFLHMWRYRVFTVIEILVIHLILYNNIFFLYK